MNDIKKEKDAMDNILKIQEYNSIDRAKAGILSILEGSFQKGKITQEQYNELTKYLEERIEQIRSNHVSKQNVHVKTNNTLQRNNIDVEQENEKDLKKQFQDKIKVTPKELNHIPIYKGQFNKVPPKSKDTKER